MAAVGDEQKTWQRSIQWLQTESGKCKEETRAATDAARSALAVMGWNSRVGLLRDTITTKDLAPFLSSVWLRSTQIDIMMEDLAKRVADGDMGIASQVIVAPLPFSETIIAQLKGSYTKQTAPLLHLYEEDIKKNGKKLLYFPANIARTHWVAGRVNFLTKRNEFGDSMPDYFEPPKRLINGLKRWLKPRFDLQFECDYAGLDHGVQIDGFSCGIITYNTIDHAIFGTGVWIPRRAVLERVQRFLKYAKHETRNSKAKEVHTFSLNCDWYSKDFIVTGLELSQEDAARFTKLSAGLKQFDAAMKLFRKREKKDDAAEDDAEE
ncbi:hypothetical protein B0H13DRAFT_2405164 [Mycena leptocephala]|nr:hypothetical protein B0H13DRAFT_2405164 [Mycena leptocephala]